MRTCSPIACGSVSERVMVSTHAVRVIMMSERSRATTSERRRAAAKPRRRTARAGSG